MIWKQLRFSHAVRLVQGDTLMVTDLANGYFAPVHIIPDPARRGSDLPNRVYCRGYSGQCDSSELSQDQDAFESQKIRPTGDASGSSSRLPAGITAMLRSGAIRGNGLPQAEQKTVRNLSASGTLKLDSISSPETQLTESGLIIRLLAWPVPLDFRQRKQWQWRKVRTFPLIS